MRRALWHTIDHRNGAQRQLWNDGLSVDLGELRTGSCFYNRIDCLRGRSVLIATQSQLAAAIALVIAYQLNVAGVGAKEGSDNRSQAPAAATAPANPSASSTPAPSSSNGSTSDGANTVHTDKPGESK